jgi:hypothetical protein
MTALLFQIGMFPYIMILSTLIFFSEEFHNRILGKFPMKNRFSNDADINSQNFQTPQWIPGIIALYVALQIILPFRHIVYAGSVFWNEQGYRFSWRVMLMEKAGYTQFKIRDRSGSKTEWVNNSEYLTPNQEKMMSTQPDMILQFAYYLQKIYANKGFEDPQIFCTSKVTLNGRRSQTFVNPDIDLMTTDRSTAVEKWLAPAPDTKI